MFQIFKLIIHICNTSADSEDNRNISFNSTVFQQQSSEFLVVTGHQGQGTGKPTLLPSWESAKGISNPMSECSKGQCAIPPRHCLHKLQSLNHISKLPPLLCRHRSYVRPSHSWWCQSTSWPSHSWWCQSTSWSLEVGRLLLVKLNKHIWNHQHKLARYYGNENHEPKELLTTGLLTSNEDFCYKMHVTMKWHGQVKAETCHPDKITQKSGGTG